MAYSFADKIEEATFYETLLKFDRLYIVTFQKLLLGELQVTYNTVCLGD
jgi:hypothetical protein